MRIIAPGDARVRVPGRYYRTFNRLYGVWVVHKWPKKRPKVSSKTQKQNKIFADAMKLVRQASGDERVAATLLTAHAPFLYQDALMAGTYGTMVPEVNWNGENLRSYRLTNTNINQLLNSISSVPGSMLVRGSDDWMAILPGNAGDTMQMDALSGTPVWAPASGGGGGNAGLLFLDSDDHFYPSGTTTLQSLVTGTIPAGLLLSPKVQVKIDWFGTMVASGSGTKTVGLSVGGISVGGLGQPTTNNTITGRCILSLTSSGKIRAQHNCIDSQGVIGSSASILVASGSFQRYDDLSLNAALAIDVAVFGQLATAGTNLVAARRLSIQALAVP